MDKALPWIINVELTNACNLACIFCDRQHLKNTMVIREIDGSLLRAILLNIRNEILPELNGEKLHEFGLVGLGEPTLNSMLVKHLAVIDTYADMFERISINSNVVSLDKERARILLDSHINSYTFSVNASNRKLYQAMMGNDVFDQVIAHLRDFLVSARPKARKIRIDIQLMDSPENNLDHLKTLLPEASAMNVHFFVRTMYSKPILHTGTPLLHVKTPADTDQRYPCWDMYTNIYIDVNGNVYPCTIGNDCYREKSQLCLGSMADHSLLELFNNQAVSGARERAQRGEIPFPECRTCNVWAITPNNFTWDPQQKCWTKKNKTVRAFGLK